MLRMKSFWIVAIILQYVCFHVSGKHALNQENTEELFQSYIEKFGKSYDEGSLEYGVRYHNFLATLERIEQKYTNFETNSDPNISAQYGLNKFSDLSQQEFRDKYLSGISLSKHFNGDIPVPSNDVPKKLDWRTKGIITPVKNQQMCGACWAFTVVELIESAWALLGNQLKVLSTQQVMDCTNNSSGCTGGNPCEALEEIKQKKLKIVESSVYPFHDSSGKCRNVSGHFGVGVSKYFCDSCTGRCPSVEMNDMIPKVVQFGTLSVSVDALSWQDYTGGIIQHHCSYDSPNHAVQIVGYDMTGAVPYWIVKNSWGRDFGDHGYLYIKIGDNLCGVANSYAGVSKVFD